MEGEIDMNASELRIGNYVEYFKSVKAVVSVNREGGTWMIGAADHKGDLTKVRNVEDGFNGIPITEEWLRKFGIKKDVGFHEHLYAVKAEGYWGIYVDVQRHNLIIEGGEWSHEAPCRYVHQLQNLYFALTGEELTIKE
jgi:hypothetical protein